MYVGADPTTVWEANGLGVNKSSENKKFEFQNVDER